MYMTPALSSFSFLLTLTARDKLTHERRRDPKIVFPRRKTKKIKFHPFCLFLRAMKATSSSSPFHPVYLPPLSTPLPPSRPPGVDSCYRSKIMANLDHEARRQFLSQIYNHKSSAEDALNRKIKTTQALKIKAKYKKYRLVIHILGSTHLALLIITATPATRYPRNPVRNAP